MASIRNLMDAVARLSDGTHTMEIRPATGDFGSTRTRPLETYLHRGRLLDDGSGVREADEVPAEGTVGFHYAESDDTDEDIHSLVRWWQGDDDSTTAIDAAGWTSTTTRADGLRTLHLEWCPDGTATGARVLSVPDALLSDIAYSEGRPTAVALTAKSSTKARITYGVLA